MARKKTGKKSSAAEGAAPEDTSDALASPSSGPAEAPSGAPSLEEPLQATTPEQPNNTPADGVHLAAQLQAAQQEIAELRTLLAAKDAELAALKQAGPTSVLQEGGTYTVTADPKRNAAMEELRSRLSALKQEQAEADSAREAAWKNLKQVVAEITKLAAPQEPPRTPTAAPAAP